MKRRKKVERKRGSAGDLELGGGDVDGWGCCEAEVRRFGEWREDDVEGKMRVEEWGSEAAKDGERERRCRRCLEFLG